jgi:PAS domain S-box-containing protein
VDVPSEAARKHHHRARNDDREAVPAAPTPAAEIALLENLRIHQVELEMQNEELRRVQSDLETSRAGYFDLYNLAPVGYLTVSEDGAILQANVRAASLLGTSNSALSHRPFSRSLTSSSSDTYYLAFRRLLETGAPQTCEVKMLRSDGTHFWARLEMSLTPGESGRVLRLVIVDITVRLQLEEALRQTNSQLAAEKRIAEEATAAKSQFLSAMSHEIRTPLNGVVGMIDLLLQTDLSTEQRDYARLLSQSAESLLGLANNILDLSKIEAGKFELEETPFNLAKLIEDALDFVSFTAKEKPLEFACWYPACTPTHFLGDAGRLRQILTNFLSNAAKFTHSGYVLVEVEAAEPIRGKAAVRVSVHDTGMGIAPETLSHLFTEFRQADATIARRFGGTGLGLAIVKQLVDLMGGEVNVSSKVGEGSTFSCRVPLKVDPTQSSPSVDNAALAEMSVLVVGVNNITRLVVSEWCQRVGMKVDQCDFSAFPTRLHSTARAAAPLDLVIVHGVFLELSEAVSSFHANAGHPAPKLVLRAADLFEESRCLAADASFPIPVRAGVFWERLQQLFPAVRPPHSHAPPPPSPEPVVAKVLVVDDNPVNRKLACALLARLGIQVETANDGAEALEKASRHDYRMVFMDCAMPVMDGFAATTAIRRLGGEKSTLPIVAITATATVENRNHCFAVGMNDFLTKPLRSDQLSACLSQWLPKN